MAWLQNQSSRKFEVKNSGCHGGFLHLDTYQLHTKLYVNRKVKCSGCFWNIFILLKYFFHHATKFSIIIGNELQRIWTSWIIGSETYNLNSLNHLFISSFIHSLHNYLLSTHYFLDLLSFDFEVSSGRTLFETPSVEEKDTIKCKFWEQSSTNQNSATQVFS